MLTKRIIPCLDVQAGKVVKGIQFKNHEIVGDIVTLAAYYNDAGADELVFYDITASCEARVVDYTWITQVAACINIPFCVAGGIKTVAQAEKILHAGADKISINSPALADPKLIERLAAAFGKQCVVIGIDSIYQYNDYYVKQYTGDPNKTQDAGRRTKDWVLEVCERGAGEIVLNCMGKDGCRDGYDIKQLREMRIAATVPLVASGGAGTLLHFKEVFEHTQVDAALAASVFHRKLISISELKQYLNQQNIEVRL